MLGVGDGLESLCIRETERLVPFAVSGHKAGLVVV